MTTFVVGADAKATQAPEECRLCHCDLDYHQGDDLTRGLCRSCKTRPEARSLGGTLLHMPLRGPGAAAPPPSERNFTEAEKSLIRKVHGYMQAPQLLDILNERLKCDLGPDAEPYTMEQLHAEIGDAIGAAPAGGHDWPSLRKLLAQAKKKGVLDAVTGQVIADFAVVFSLTPKQLLSLKDILLQPAEDEA